MSGYMCDNEDETPAHMVLSNTTNGEVFAFCGPCLAEFMWTFVEALPDYDERIKARMVALAELEEARRSAADRRSRRKARSTEEGKDTDAVAAGESTPEDVTAG